MENNNNIILNFEKLINILTLNLYNEKQNKNSNTKLLSIKLASTKKALNIIKNFDKPITKGEDLKHIKGIGPKFIKNINEIIETGHLSKCDIETQQHSNNNSINNDFKEIKLLQKITGIGQVKASKLFKEGITLNTLLDAYNNNNNDILDKLTHHQLLGVKYYNDLEIRIPYNEITLIEIYLKNIISNIDTNLNLIICGSYRRQSVNSGDIDILLYHKDIVNKTQMDSCQYLTNFLNVLIKNKFLQDHLTINGNTKYMGFCKYENNPVRRIDIRFIPTECLGASKLYFTGSGDFNKNMRSFALKQNYTINEYGIFKINDDKNKTIVKTNTEKDIFNILGLEYVEPINRLSNYKF